jgi:hypothetical protein
VIESISRLLNTRGRVRAKFRVDNLIIDKNIVIIPEIRIGTIAFAIDKRLLTECITNLLGILVVSTIFIKEGAHIRSNFGGTSSVW